MPITLIKIILSHLTHDIIISLYFIILFDRVVRQMNGFVFFIHRNLVSLTTDSMHA